MITFVLSKETQKEQMYTKTYHITAGDMDVNYRMTPSAALLYFQDCYASYLALHHIAAFDILKEGKIWVISDFDLHFTDSRALWLDAVKVDLSYSEITSCRAYIKFVMSTEHEGRVFAEGESCWTILDIESRRPCNVAEILERAHAADEGIRHRGKINPKVADAELKMVAPHPVNTTDLDFNGHVCNRSYMAMAMSTIPLELIKVANPEYVHIKFAKESFLGQTLDINVWAKPERSITSADQDIEIFHDIRNENQDVICTVYSEWKIDKDDLSRDPADIILRK